MDDSEQVCPYCGGKTERGAMISGFPLWWAINPIRKRWRLKAQSRKLLGSFLSGFFRYGMRCHQCNLLIIDLTNPKIVEGRK